MGPGHEVLSFVGSTEGDIVEVTGPEGFGWDPIFKVQTCTSLHYSFPFKSFSVLVLRTIAPCTAVWFGKDFRPNVAGGEKQNLASLSSFSRIEIPLHLAYRIVARIARIPVIE